jgi:hypothetical protein
MSKSNEPEDNTIVQDGNTVHGDLAGRDINKPVTVNIGHISALRRRSQELKELYVHDQNYRGFIEKLQKFLTTAESSKQPRNLEEKLTAGNRADLVNEGKRLKERFYKKINKHQFSEQAQELFAHILAQINTFFNSKIRPLIIENQQPSVIDALIYDDLVKVIYDDVGDGPLDIDTEDIKGMLYYLTGTCHLEWD